MRHAAGTLQRDDAADQAEAAPRRIVEPAREIGVVAALQNVDDRRVGLGLGGEIGARATCSIALRAAVSRAATASSFANAARPKSTTFCAGGL